jgi:hypothetical protein
VSSYIWGSLFSLSALDTAMARRSTVSSIQERWTAVRMSGMSAFRRCTNLSRVRYLEHSRSTRGSPLYGPYMVRTGFRELGVKIEGIRLLATLYTTGEGANSFSATLPE